MNASDFGLYSDRAYSQGACAWVDDKEWCGTPVVVTDYRGFLNPPANYQYGAMFGISIPTGLPPLKAMMICDNHRLDFLKLNGPQVDSDTEIWQMDYNGIGRNVTYRFSMHDCLNCGGHSRPWKDTE